MLKITTSLIPCAALAALTACSQPEPVIYAEPTYDKFGNATCVPDNPLPGTSYPTDLPPCEPEDCEETTTAGTAAIPCPPPTTFTRPEGDDSTSRGGRTAGRP